MPVLRRVPAHTLAARGAPRARALNGGETDDGIPFGWFVLQDHHEDPHESIEAAVMPYLDPPNKLWFYQTAEDADFLDMSQVATVDGVRRRLDPEGRRALDKAFPRVGGRVLRHSNHRVDVALAQSMARAGILSPRGTRGWTHPTMPRPDGGIHRREVLALQPSLYLKSVRHDASPTASPSAFPRVHHHRSPRSPRSPSSPSSGGPRRMTTAKPHRSPVRTPSPGAKMPRLMLQF